MPRHNHVPKWLKLLGEDAKLKQNLFEKYPENFRLDHPDQAAIHSDCQSLESKSPIFQETDLKNALELLLTYYCKTEEISYKSGLHEVLAPFFIMRFNNLKTVYGAFSTFIEKMIPGAYSSEKNSDYFYSVFQKLMMYHEPILFNTLQSAHSTHVPIVKKWFLTAMASLLETGSLLKLWEFCFTEKNYTLPLFVAIAVLYRQRENLQKKNKAKGFCFEESGDDIQGIIQEAVAYQKNTPESFNALIYKVLVEKSISKTHLRALESVSILSASEKELKKAPANYIIIDTRPLKVYQKAHFGQSFSFSSELFITTGKFLFRLEELWSILSGFTAFFHNKYSKPCHYIFITDANELKNVSTLCLDLVRRGIEKVSLLPVAFEDSTHSECPKCRFAKEIAGICKKQMDKKQILTLMWENYLSEHQTDSHPANGFNKLRDSAGFESMNKDLGKISMYECLKLMWTSNLLDAENWFESKKEEDPRCSLHFAEAGFLKALLLGDAGSKEIVTERLNSTEKTASAHVKYWKAKGNRVFELQNIKKTEAAEIIKASQQLRLGLSVKAESTLFKSGTELLQRKLTTGSVNFRRAWKLYQKAKKIGEAQKLVEQHFCSKEQIGSGFHGIESDIKSLIGFGEGVICLGLSMAPHSMSKVARAEIGGELDQNKGIKQLYECINAKIGIRVPLALMFLSFWLLIYIPDYIPGKKERLREAYELIRFSLHYYQQSPFFYWLESYLNQKQGNLERSLKLLNRVISKSHKLGLTIVPGRLNFERGWVLFLCHEWTSAAKCLEEANRSGSTTPFAKLVLGICYCMIGNLDSGQAMLELIEKASASTPERWVCRRASRYLQRRRFQIFPFELIYVTDSMSTLKSEWLEGCLDYLGHISMDIESQDEIEEKVVWLLLRGTIFRLMGRLQQSVVALQEGIYFEAEVREEIWAIPHLYYELAMNFAKSRDWVSSMKYIRMARAYKRKYEFSNALTFKLNSAMDMAMQEENKEFNK